MTLCQDGWEIHLREVDGYALVPWRSNLLALILVYPETREVRFASTLRRKRELLGSIPPEGADESRPLVLMAWPGKSRQDIFLLSPGAVKECFRATTG